VRAAPLIPLALAGCTTITPSFDSPEPAARNAAIVRAAASNDQAAVPDLVRMLESDDPTTRVLAIQTLLRLTGQDLGYDPSDTPSRRDTAVDRWRARTSDYKPGIARTAP
jgi:HEAT repeat protein